MTPLAKPIIADLIEPAGWTAIFLESGSDIAPLEISVTHTAPDAWRVVHRSGAEVIADSRKIIVSDGVTQTVLEASNAGLSLPTGLDLLGVPDPDYLQRLLDQAVEIGREKHEGRLVWRVVSEDGSSYVLDGNECVGHALVSPSHLNIRSSYSAELRGLVLESPPATAYAVVDRPTATRSGLGRVGVRLDNRGRISVWPPEHEIYFRGQPWAGEVGPAFESFEPALEWCQLRADAVEVAVDGPRGREIFGMGSWPGQKFRALPEWLRGQ